MVKQLVLATKNHGKAREFAAAFSLAHMELKELTQDFVMPQETGTTFLENALIKARYAAQTLQQVVLADDSGLSVKALGGAPGVHSARYAGEHAADAQNCAKLLQALLEVEDARREARFTTVLALVWPDGREITVTGVCDGYIVSSPTGDGGFGYDPLFYYPPLHKTFAQMSMEEKNQVSHRAQAIHLLLPSFSLLE